MSNIEWLNISPLAEFYKVKPPKGKGKGSATTKKMVIADPGLAVEITFEAEQGEEWENVKMRFDLYVIDDGDPIPTSESTPSHSVEFGIHNGESILETPATYSFVVPFADRNWVQEMDEGKNLYYRFKFAVIEPTSEWGHGDIKGVPANSLAANKTFDYTPHGVGAPHTIGQITYSFVTKNAGAVAWNENYYSDATYTSIRDNQTRKEAYFLPFSSLGGDHSPINGEVACLLPIPLLTTGTPVMDILRTNNGTSNWDLDLSTVDPTSGSIEIKLVDPGSS